MLSNYHLLQVEVTLCSRSVDWRSVDFLKNDFYNHFLCNNKKSTSRSLNILNFEMWHAPVHFQDVKYIIYVKFQDLGLFAVRILEP